jgi:phosphoesterase RecJ-like protein
VSTVAAHFGGGGHKNAAGLAVEGSFQEVVEKVVSELEKLVDANYEPPLEVAGQTSKPLTK